MPTHGAILLGEVAQHLATVHISCNFCPRRGKASVGRLMHEHGPDMPIPDLLRRSQQEICGSTRGHVIPERSAGGNQQGGPCQRCWPGAAPIGTTAALSREIWSP
jgi:hypothetical protein